MLAQLIPRRARKPGGGSGRSPIVGRSSCCAALMRCPILSVERLFELPVRREVTGTGGQNPKNWVGTADRAKLNPRQSVPAVCHQPADGGVELIQVDRLGQVHGEPGVGGGA